MHKVFDNKIDHAILIFAMNLGIDPNFHIQIQIEEEAEESNNRP